MSCNIVSQPSRTRRTVLTMGLERQFDSNDCRTRTDGLVQTLLYENLNPTQADFQTIKLNRARNGLSPEGILVALGTYQITGSLYMVGSGIPNVAPVWTQILRACGWKETRYVDPASSISITLNDVTAVGVDAGTGHIAAGTRNYRLSVVSGTATLGECAATTLTQDTGAGSAAAGGIIGSGVVGKITLDWSTASDFHDAAHVDGAKVRIYGTLIDPSVDIDPTTGEAFGSSRYFFIAEVDGTDDGYVDKFDDHDLVDPQPTSALGAATKFIQWVPLNAYQDSLTIMSFLDSRKYPAAAVRGTMAFNGNFGEPFRGDFDLKGLYSDSEKVANPTPLSTPGFPPRLIKTALSILAAGDDPETESIVPKIKSIGVVLGTNTTERGDTNADEGLIEYGIYEEYAPRINLTVEVDGNMDWIDSMKKGIKYRIQFTLSPEGVADSDPGTRIMVVAGDDPVNTFDDPNTGSEFGCQLVTTPKFDDSNGQRVFRLEFEPGEVDSGALIEQHFLKFFQF